MPRIDTRNKKDVEIAEQIAKYMVRRNMKMKDLAKLTCTPKSTLSKAIHDMSYMRVHLLRRIYDVLQVPAEDRLGL